jgi:tRNA G26 N,N-dimethylase Trm1
VKLLKKLKTENEKLAKLIKVILSEQDITTPFYEVSKLAEIHKIPMPRKKDILEAVLSQDEKASETHFSHTGIRSETMLRI